MPNFLQPKLSRPKLF